MTDKSQQAAVARQRKLAQLQRIQRRGRRRRRWLIWGTAAVLVAALVGGTAVLVRGSGSSVRIAGVRSFTGLSRQHVSGPVRYPQAPPVGGAHSPVPQNCGIYDQPVPNENAVHSLEHGAVWITYRPGLKAADIATLAHDVRGKPYTLLSPYPGLPASVVASAWGEQLRLSTTSDPRLAAFIRTYANGPQTPEPGAACSGGVGTPRQ